MKSYVYISAMFILFFSACISKQAVVKKHYTIEWPESTSVTPIDSLEVIQGSCEIEPVRMHSLYERNQIVNRSDSHEITFYKYHQWAIKPSTSIIELLTRYLDKKHLFQSVSTRYNLTIPDFRLVTEVLKMEVIEEDKDQFLAHVHLILRLIDNENNEEIVRHEAERFLATQEKDLNIFAKNVSIIFISEFEVFAELITQKQADLTGRIPKG